MKTVEELNKILDEVLNGEEDTNKSKGTGKGKYFYIVGEAEKDSSYTDHDIGMVVHEPVYVGRGWEDKGRFDTFEEVLAEVVKDGYWKITSTCNFPDGLEEDLELLTNEDEAKLKPEEYPNYYELLSYFTENEEDFGPEYHEVTELVTRLIQICKEK